MVLCLMISAALIASSVEVKVAPLAGEAVSGILKGVSNEGIVLESREGEQRFSREQLRLVEMEQPGAGAEPVEVLLTDGSRFFASTVELSDSRASFRLPGGATTQLRVHHVRAILLKPLGDRASRLRQQWNRILSESGESDILVFRRSDSDAETNLDQIEGVVYGMNEETVSFEFDGDRIEPKRAKLDGLVFYRPTAGGMPDAICRVGDIAGATFEAIDLKLEGDQLAIKTRSKAEFKLPLARLQYLDFSAGNLVYLSDLPPTSVEWEPYVQTGISDSLRQRNLPQSDRAFDGGPLMLGGKSYTKGLAIHSKTTLVYRFQDRYRRFQATAGLDDRVRNSRIPPHLRLIILSENGVLFEEEFGPDTEPIELDLKIDDVQRLTLIVEFGEQGDIADHLNLCDARIIK